jgi:hypothetical protein
MEVEAVTAAVEAVTAALEAVTTPVTVVVEASSGACRQSAQEAHSARTPPGLEPEGPVSVPAPDDVGTPALARHGV